MADQGRSSAALLHAPSGPATRRDTIPAPIARMHAPRSIAVSRRGPTLHRHPAGGWAQPRHLRQQDRGRCLPRLREAQRRQRGDRLRRLTHGPLHVLRLIRCRRPALAPAGSPDRGTARKPALETGSRVSVASAPARTDSSRTAPGPTPPTRPWHGSRRRLRWLPIFFGATFSVARRRAARFR